VCVCTFLDEISPICVKTFICIVCMLFTCALACVYYAHTIHVRALGSHQKCDEILLGSQKRAWRSWILNTMRALCTCVHFTLLCAHYTRACTSHMCAFAHYLSEIGGNIPLHVLHAFYVHVCVTNYVYTTHVRALHVCARSQSVWVTGSAMDYFIYTLPNMLLNHYTNLYCLYRVHQLFRH
jgi:hypothetical protein